MQTLIASILALVMLSACSVPGGKEVTGPDNPSGIEDPNAPIDVTPGDGDFTTLPADGNSGAFSPQKGDAGLSIGNVYLDSAELLILESYPIQVNLYISGNLPTPCNELRVKVNDPDTNNRIYIEIYSVSNPDTMCVQVLQPFDTNISLGSFSPGHYKVYLNGELIGEFDS
jgi:hypothetical protein